MANKAAQIPIMDESTLEGCTQYYIVRYKGQGTDLWITMSPNPIRQPITIENLFGGGIYDVEIIRTCCNGLQSSPTTLTLAVPV